MHYRNEIIANERHVLNVDFVLICHLFFPEIKHEDKVKTSYINLYIHAGRNSTFIEKVVDKSTLVRPLLKLSFPSWFPGIGRDVLA